MVLGALYEVMQELYGGVIMNYTQVSWNSTEKCMEFYGYIYIYVYTYIYIEREGEREREREKESER